MTTTNRSTVSGYFLAGRFMTWLPVSYLSFSQGLSIIIVVFSSYGDGDLQYRIKKLAKRKDSKHEKFPEFYITFHHFEFAESLSIQSLFAFFLKFDFVFFVPSEGIYDGPILILIILAFPYKLNFCFIFVFLTKVLRSNICRMNTNFSVWCIYDIRVIFKWWFKRCIYILLYIKLIFMAGTNWTLFPIVCKRAKQCAWISILF